LDVRLTQHVRNKIAELRRYGFDLTEEDIVETVRNPSRVLQGYSGQLIAQKPFTEKHLLRIVYELREEVALCITVYPARRSRYE